jgi:hypothetical protein
MTVNWKRFATLFALLNIALFLTGCGWVSAVQALMPGIKIAITALFSLIASLTGKTIPPNVTAFVQKIEDDVAAALVTVGDILSTISSNVGQSVLTQLQAVFEAITTNLNSLLTGLGVSDTSTIARITEIIAAIVTAIEAVLALLPLAAVAKTLTPEEAVHADKAATNSLKNAHKVFQQRYVVAITPDTGNPDVDAALASITPRTLP